MEIIGITVVSIVSEQAAYKAELEQLSQERRFSPRKALERKAETEARYFFLQRVYDDSARLEIMLDIYAGWVGRMSTPRGLAEFVLKDHDDGLMGQWGGIGGGSDGRGDHLDCVLVCFWLVGGIDNWIGLACLDGVGKTKMEIGCFYRSCLQTTQCIPEDVR
jgi:hypothetical protein